MKRYWGSISWNFGWVICALPCVRMTIEENSCAFDLLGIRSLRLGEVHRAEVQRVIFVEGLRGEKLGIAFWTGDSSIFPIISRNEDAADGLDDCGWPTIQEWMWWSELYKILKSSR